MKKIISCACAALIVGASLVVNSGKSSSEDLLLLNAEALAEAEVNPACPNGCVEPYGNWCFCFEEHPYTEAKW